jgi:hypothetical protein
MTPMRFMLRGIVVYAVTFGGNVLCPAAFKGLFAASVLTVQLNSLGIIGLILGIYIASRVR